MEKTIWGEQIAIASPAGRIAASFHYPESGIDSAGAVVIMLHGLGGNRHEHNGIFTRMASRLAESGLMAVRFDFCGNGESDRSSEFMTLDSMLADIESVIAYSKTLLKRDQVDIYVLGLSLGGLLAALTASKYPNVKAAVLWEPPFNLVATLKRLYGPLSFDKVRIRGYLQAGLLKLNADFIQQFEALDTNSICGLVSQPVLLVQGTADQVVTVGDADKWNEAMALNERFESVFIKDADHAFSSEKHALEVIELTLDWLKTK